MKNLTIEIKANTKKAVDDINKLKTKIKEFGTNIKKSNGDLAKQNTALTSLSSSLKSLALAYVSMEGAKSLVNTLIELENGMIGVAKTTGLTGVNLQELSNKLDTLASDLKGISILELQGIAEIAGQLGITGTENILSFTEGIGKIAVATDLTVEAASRDFAILANILKEPISNTEKLGSVINELSNTTTATASDIVGLANRIAGAGQQIGLTSAQVFGLSATLKDIGASTEAGGSAISTIFGLMTANVEDFASASGVSLKEFKDAIEKDPIEALKLFLNQFKELDIYAQEDTLARLGLGGIETKAIVQKLSGATDVLNKNMKTARDEYKENTSLQKEYEIASNSLESALKDIKDEILLAVKVMGKDLIPILKDLSRGTAEWIKSLSKEDIQRFTDGTKALLKVLSSMASVLAKSAEGWGLIGDAISKFSRAVSDDFDDAVTKGAKSFDDLSKKINTFDGNNEEFEKLQESIKKVVRANKEHLEQMAKDGPEYYAEQIKDLSTQNKNLLKIYQELETKKPLEKAIENTNEATGATNELTDATKQLTLAEKEQAKALEETKKKELEDLNKTYTKRVQQHTQTIFSLKNNETKLSNDIIKLNQDLQKKLANIETQRVHNAESIETQISNIRSSDAGKYEQYTNQKRTAEENLSKAKKALAEGDSQEYKHYADIYKGLVSSIAGTEITEKKKVKKYNRETHKWEKKTIDVIKLKKSDSNAYAINSLENLKGLENNYYAQKKQEEVTLHNQKVQQLQVQLQATKAQLEMEVQRLAIEKQILEATTGQTFNIDISGALASIKNIDNQIDLLDTQIKTVKPLKVDTSDAVQKVEEVRKYYGNLTLNDITFTVTADRTPADYGISKFITEHDGEHVTIRINPEYKEAQQRISDAIKNFENKPVVTKVDVDTKKATSGTKKFQQQATKPLTSKISADVSKATNSIKKVQSLAKKIIVLTVKANISKAEIAIRKLQKSTSSTHTVYVKKVETHKAGGMVGDVLKLATGGKADFERKQGRISGYDPTDSDDVYAKLTRGEFVIKRDTVKHYGDDFLNRLNAQQLPKFATGGLVQAGTPEKLITQYSNNNNNNNSDDKFDLSSLYELLRNIALFKIKPMGKSFKKQLSSISKRATAQEVNGNSINDKKEELSKKNQQISDVKKESFLSGKSLKDNTKLSSLTNQTDTINDDIKLKIKIFEEKVRKITLALELLQAKYEQYQAKLSDVKEKIKKLFEKNKLELPTRIQEGTDLKKLELFNDKIHNLKPYKTHARNGSTSIHDSRWGTKYKTETVASQIEDKLKWFPKFQTGGHINGLEGGRLDGYGGGDKNLALLEDGEFIIRKEAVKRFGTDAMHKLNSMTVNLPKFQAGGSVGGANISSLASANNNSRNQTDINFQMPNGNSYALSSDTDIADNLAEEFRRLM